MRDLAYYIYNDIDNCVCRCDLINAEATKSLDFWIAANGKYHFRNRLFDSKSKLLKCLNEMNESTAKSYTKAFLIPPPYYVEQSLQIAMNMLTTRIVTYNRISVFVVAGGPTGCEDGTVFERFLFSNREQRFDIDYLKHVHMFVVNSKVIRPIMNERGDN